MDIVISLAAIILVSPIMLLTALLVKLTSPGPIFFVQKRLGLNKRMFHIYKFRTMVMDAEQRLKDLEHLNEANGAGVQDQERSAYHSDWRLSAQDQHRRTCLSSSTS